MGSCLPGLIPAATGLLVLSMAWDLCSCPQRYGGARRACCHTEGPTHVTLIVLGHRACLLLFDWATPRRGSRLPCCLSSVAGMVAHQRRRQTTPFGSFSPHSQLHTGALSLCLLPSSLLASTGFLLSSGCLKKSEGLSLMRYLYLLKVLWLSSL